MEVIEQAVRDGVTPSADLVVLHRGEVVLEHRVGAPAEATWDLASLTKPLATATCVMMLVDQGGIDLNDPVAKYLPDFASEGKGPVQIRHLLTHTSGLPAWPFAVVFPLSCTPCSVRAVVMGAVCGCEVSRLRTVVPGACRDEFRCKCHALRSACS